MTILIERIQPSILKLVNHAGFLSWLNSETVNAGDFIVVNNSFVYRDVGTVKNEKHLVLRVNDNGNIESKPYVMSGIRMNSDFKRLAKESKNLTAISDFDAIVQNELSQIGMLAFILIGQVDDTVILEQPIDHQELDSLIWDPQMSDFVCIDESKVFVRDTHDEESVWYEITNRYAKRNEAIPDGLREAVGVALDKLQDQAVATLQLPTTLSGGERGITDAIVDVLVEQRAEYAKALTQCSGDPKVSPNAYNEVLRIAYNFASDATTFLQLIVSICDLKPLVLWGTIGEHYRLSEAFRNLPWTRSRNKPSLKNYTSIIGDARNSAFHNLFPFRKSLKMTLPGSAFQQVSLQIFSEHSKKKENQLDYQDKELVEVLLEFTRARDRRASARFWQQNLEVMDATIELFRNTNEHLKLLYSTISQK